MPSRDGRIGGSGTWSHEISVDEGSNGQVFDITNETYPEVLQPLGALMMAKGIDYGEIVIEFGVSGYHQEKSMFGGPDRLGWPEEHSEEREIEEVYIYARNTAWIDGSNEYAPGSPRKMVKIPVPEPLASAIYAEYEDEVNESKFETPEPDYDDRDPYESIVKKVSRLITEDPDIMA
jgi:hypothetical protein